MYEKFYRLKEKPFENNPDGRFLYHTQQHEEALARLAYAVEARKGAAMLTGVFGCGKTLIATMIAENHGSGNYRSAVITDPALQPVEFLRMLLFKLNPNIVASQKAEMLIAIEHTLANNMADGRHTVVIVDEAHVIDDPATFEQIRLLLNFQTGNQFLLTVLLVGQPELREKVDNNKPLAQRIAVGCHLGALNREHTEAYITCRLFVSGCDREIFSKGAVDLVFDFAQGIPRRINQVCDMSLLSGYGSGREVIDKDLVADVIKTMGI